MDFIRELIDIHWNSASDCWKGVCFNMGHTPNILHVNWRHDDDRTNGFGDRLFQAKALGPGQSSDTLGHDGTMFREDEGVEQAFTIIPSGHD